ncbi:efflux RND transporter periplasmic adaptor subunit [Pseudomonas sp. MUP55]|uniref:efflux RND transporter periplasmic adaptor subunit n=1 Tax=Pseudomonas sp. MUP55 TaxID=3087234 RepID=UPI002A5A90B3|nr:MULTISPECIES: efflux RND transporter periplasmic adaptor subunit [unclassified Pseudomonas]WPN93576.1 efflux RND transporter periplasmic adaptor subunit [Pseudomonas sp. MUP56]WPN99102.1 efflux RND transporter periplasmic adaptor subunit [Pseudomonas sp. MUP55]
MRRFRYAAVAICLFPFVLTACDESSSERDPRIQPPLVRAAIVASANGASRSFTGVVVARVQSDLGFRVSGKVSERLVDTGQEVKLGQTLMRLDPIDLGLQAQAQIQAVAAAAARAKQAADDEARNRNLVAAGAISASAYDRIKALADTSKAELNAAQAQANVARNATGYATLLADADGVVIETLAEPGQVVSSGQPVVRLAKAGPREAIIHLPETVRPVLGDMAQAKFYGSDAKVIPAKLRLLSDAADPLTRTFEARYVLDDANAPLGSTVTLRLSDGKAAQPALAVPMAAIYDPGKGPGVWVVAGTPATVSWRAVQLLGLSDDAATVSGGVKPGEQIVALGAHLLHEGEQVRVQQPGNGISGERP